MDDFSRISCTNLSTKFANSCEFFARNLVMLRMACTVNASKQKQLTNKIVLLWIINSDAAVKKRCLAATLCVTLIGKLLLAGLFSAKLNKHQLVSWLLYEQYVNLDMSNNYNNFAWTDNDKTQAANESSALKTNIIVVLKISSCIFLERNGYKKPMRSATCPSQV